MGTSISSNPVMHHFVRNKLILPLIMCIGVGLSVSTFSLRSDAQGVSAVSQTSAEPADKATVPQAQPLPVVVSEAVNEASIDRSELAIRLALGACAIWIIALSFAQKQGTFKLAAPFCGSLLLIDAASAQGQINWWCASNGSPYDPAIGLAIPGVIGSVLIFAFVILLRLDQRRVQRIVISMIALCVLIASFALGYSAWPTHLPSTNGFH